MLKYGRQHGIHRCNVSFGYLFVTKPIGTFYLKKFIGIGGDSLSKYMDLDKDGIDTDKDRVASGSALPDILYNFYGNVSYKGFDLSANFNGVSGNKIYDLTANTSFLKVRLAKNVNSLMKAYPPGRLLVKSNSCPCPGLYCGSTGPTGKLLMLLFLPCTKIRW